MFEDIRGLPIDLQMKIYEDVISLRKHHAIDSELLKDIHSNYHLNQLIQTYATHFGEEENRHLHWLENNLLYYMNGYTPLLLYVNERFHSIFPDKDNAEIRESLFSVLVDERSLKRRIKQFWFGLCHEERFEFFNLENWVR